MTVAAAVRAGRALAESLMTSTCTIRDRSGGSVMDPDTLEYTATPGAVVYSGKCRIRPAAGPAGDSSTREIGGVEMYAFDYLVSVPFVVADVREGQRVTIDSSADPALVGVELEVSHVDRGEHITSRRLQCAEVA